MRDWHTIVAVRLKPRITILLKRKPTARSRAAPTEGRPFIQHNQTERPLSVCHFTIGIIYELPKLADLA